MSGNNKEINIVNMIEEYLNKIPLKTWQAACAVSPESNEVCGMLLAATGLVSHGGRRRRRYEQRRR